MGALVWGCGGLVWGCGGSKSGAVECGGLSWVAKLLQSLCSGEGGALLMLRSLLKRRFITFSNLGNKVLFILSQNRHRC